MTIAIGIEIAIAIEIENDTWTPKTGCLPSINRRMAAMLNRLGGRRYWVKEASAVYGFEEVDFDPEENKPRQADALHAHS